MIRVPPGKEKGMSGELHSVVLKTDLLEYGLKRGDIGTVVLVHGTKGRV